jgi:hypothetical protein
MVICAIIVTALIRDDNVHLRSTHNDVYDV